MILKYLTLACLVNFIACWPNFFFFSQKNPNTHVTINASNIISSGFDFSKETKFVVHGFTNDGLDSKFVKIKNSFIDSGFDYNIILVDWKEGARGPNYFEAADNVDESGTKVGQFIKEAGIDPSKVHCIGHSLGAHVCGFAGKQIHLRRISGLDPAGPLFFYKNKDKRLDKSDADFVDNIHTDSTLGDSNPIGHLDFYPNGGRAQLGCGINSIFDKKRPDDEIISLKLSPRLPEVKKIGCSHNRAPAYFAESISSPCRFHSVPCDVYDGFANGRCQCDPKIGCAPMGYFASQSYPEGTYFLDTNKEEPYCLL